MKNFLKWTFSSKIRRAKLIFLILFSLLGRIYFYSELLNIPCDGQFLCGFYNHLNEFPWFTIIMMEFFTTVPFAAVVISYYGLFKKSLK